MSVRPLKAVPRGVLVLLAAALVLQLGWHTSRPPPSARADVLPPAPPLATLQLASLGEPLALSKLSMLYLQSHDDQAGARQPLNQLDYGAVSGWLMRALELDPRGQYPLLLASQVYGAASEPAKVRLMLDFVYRRFEEDPRRRWPWLAHAALVAKHRLHDLPLARRYAQAIRERATGKDVPAWAGQLEIFILEDMNEPDSASKLVGGLIDSGRLTDPRELAFLSRRLDEIAARQRLAPKD